MSGIDNAKAVMGYQAAMARPACRNCKHCEQQFADRAPPWDKASWKCKKGGFFTSGGAICRQHEPKSESSPRLWEALPYVREVPNAHI